METAPAMERSTEQKNFHHLVMNTVWFGLATPALARFLSVYAIRVGATPLELGLLSSLPGIAAVFSAFFAQRWMSRHDTSVKAVFWPALGLRMNLLLLTLTPLLPAPWQPAWIIIAITLPAMPEGISGVAFLVAMREAVSEHLITPLVSRRQLMLNITLGGGTLAFGFWLERAPFPINYQVMFGLGFACALVSLWHTMQVKVAPGERRPPERNGTLTRVWRSRGFMTVALLTVFTHIAFFSIISIIPLRLVNEMGAGEQFMAFFGLVELGGSAGIALFTNRITRKIGSQALITWSMFGTALAAVLLALAPELPFTLLAALISGASWTATGIGLFSFFSANTPLDDAPRFTTAYIQIIYLAIFIGPLLGSGLASAGVNLTTVLLFGAGLRLIVALGTQMHRLHLDRLSPGRTTA